MPGKTWGYKEWKKPKDKLYIPRVMAKINIRKYARRLKEENIREWEPEERLKAITEFALLTIQMKNLEHTS